MKIKAKYRSSLFTIVIPGITALAAAGAVIFSAFTFFEMESLWHSFALVASTLAAVVVSVVIVHPLAEKLSGLKKGTLGAEGSVLEWDTGSGMQSIDLSGKHTVSLYSGAASEGMGAEIQSSVIMIENESSAVNITLRNSDREETAACFGDGNFIYDYSFTPESGMASFDLSAGEEDEKKMFLHILKVLKENRENCMSWRAHEKFPWHHAPSPGSTCTVLLDPSREDDRGRIESIKREAFFKYHNRLFCTGDCVLVSADVSVADMILAAVSPDRLNECFLYMPAGYSRAQAVFQNVISGGSGLTTKVQRLEISGTDSMGRETAARLAWPKEGFANIERYMIEALIRFLDKKKVQA